ncbi:putative SMC domain-containing protein [Salmonella phage SPFM15]|nr:putative SMC domain-containing protein [Salmonella phage SPFM5]VFR13709.1 putative SMC domain-containing protein [Salmonella phage SPFM15]
MALEVHSKLNEATYCVVEPEGVTIKSLALSGEFSQLLVVSHEALLDEPSEGMDEEHKNRLVNFFNMMFRLTAYKALGLQNYPLKDHEELVPDVKKGSKAQRIMQVIPCDLTDGDLDYTFPVRLITRIMDLMNRYIEMVWAYPILIINAVSPEKGLLRRYFYAARLAELEKEQAELLKEHHHARKLDAYTSARERFRQMEGAIAEMNISVNNVVVRELLNRREALQQTKEAIERFQKGYEHLVSNRRLIEYRRQANELERETTHNVDGALSQKIEHIRSQLDGAQSAKLATAEREWQEAVAAVGYGAIARAFTEELDSAMMYLRVGLFFRKLQELDIFTTSRDRDVRSLRTIREIVMSYSNHPVKKQLKDEMDSLLRDRKEIEDPGIRKSLPEIEKAINDNEGCRQHFLETAEVDCPQCNHRFRAGLSEKLQRCENVLHGLYHEKTTDRLGALEKRLQGMDLTSNALNDACNWNLPLSMHLDQLQNWMFPALFEGTRIDVDSIHNHTGLKQTIDSLKQELATFQYNKELSQLLDEESRQAYLMRQSRVVAWREQAASAETECNIVKLIMERYGVLPSDELINEFLDNAVSVDSIRKRIASLQPALKELDAELQELNRTIEARPGGEAKMRVVDDEEDRARLEVRRLRKLASSLSGAIEHTGRKIRKWFTLMSESDLTYVVGCYREIKELINGETLLTDATTEVRDSVNAKVYNSMVEQLTGITKRRGSSLSCSIFNITKGVSIVGGSYTNYALVGDDRLKFEVLKTSLLSVFLPLAPAKSEFRETFDFTLKSTVTIILGGNGCGLKVERIILKGFTGMGLHEIDFYA